MERRHTLFQLHLLSINKSIVGTGPNAYWITTDGYSSFGWWVDCSPLTLRSFIRSPWSRRLSSLAACAYRAKSIEKQPAQEHKLRPWSSIAIRENPRGSVGSPFCQFHGVFLWLAAIKRPKTTEVNFRNNSSSDVTRCAGSVTGSPATRNNPWQERKF